MISKKWIACVIVAGFLSVILIDQLLSQPAPPQGGPGQGEGRMRFDPQQMQQRMMERMKETLAATDDEWKIIEPRLTSVMTLSREVNARGMMRGFFGGGRRGGDDQRQRPGGQEDTTRVQSDVEKSTAALQAVLENESASAAEIKQVLTALRTAKEKSKQKLAKAQEELRQVLSVRQEAQMVLMGYLN
ncbi:MAG: hypothetical protein JW810_01115 [Sedimentisphaerales bacterium]|nr:hypothetical protein [Sedimentisphaerales bacterium]